MKIQQMRDIARGHGLNPGRLGKIDLVRAIQRDEGTTTASPPPMTVCATSTSACGAKTASPPPAAPGKSMPGVGGRRSGAWR